MRHKTICAAHSALGGFGSGAAIYDASGVFLELCQCIGRLYGLAVALRVDFPGTSQDQLLSQRE
jgi:hypothetical protein